MIHYTQIIWQEVAFSWKVTGKSVAISIAPTVHCKQYKKFRYNSCLYRLFERKVSHNIKTVEP